MTDEWFSVDQVAQRLGLHVRTVRNYVRDGRLKAVRIGKQYRIARSDLEELTGRALPVLWRRTPGAAGGWRPRASCRSTRSPPRMRIG